MMKNIVVIGSGFAGQTAALFLRKELGSDYDVIMVTPADRFTYQPSLVWVGIDNMRAEQATFPLAPVYKRKGITYKQAYAREIHPDDQYVVIEHVGSGKKEEIPYDYLVNATGPLLNFAGTPGMGPDEGTSHSICTAGHAEETRRAYIDALDRMRQGEKIKFVIGTGHGMATCQGAAFEYITNIHNDLKRRGLRHRAEILWVSNEPALGDFGVDGLHWKKGGGLADSERFATELFKSFGIDWQVQTAITKVEHGKAHYETISGKVGTIDFDFAMLIPQFKGIPLRYIDGDGQDITKEMTNPAGYMLVDGTYGKRWEDIEPEDWPKTYQNPRYPNIFAAGIAFAPVGTISKPYKSPSGLDITATAPRTGMTAGMTGEAVAMNIIDLINGRAPSHEAPLTNLPGACIASVAKSIWNGEAASMIMYPVAKDFKTYPETGRNLDVTRAELGIAGAWIKRSLHTAFMYKMKGLPGWSKIPG